MSDKLIPIYVTSHERDVIKHILDEYDKAIQINDSTFNTIGKFVPKTIALTATSDLVTQVGEGDMDMPYLTPIGDSGFGHIGIVNNRDIIENSVGLFTVPCVEMDKFYSIYPYILCKIKGGTLFWLEPSSDQHNVTYASNIDIPIGSEIYCVALVNPCRL